MRWVPLGGLTLAAFLALTWTDPALAAPAVAGFLGVVVCLHRHERTLALLLLAASAGLLAVTPASLADWRPWVLLGALVPVLDASLRGPEPGTPPTWRTVGLVATLLAVGVALALWRPTHAALAGEDGVLMATLLLAAAGGILGLLVGVSDPPEGEDA